MRRYKDKRKLSVGQSILDFLWSMADVTAAMGFEAPYQQLRRLRREDVGAPELQRWKYNQTVNYLKRDGNLEVIEKNNRLFLKLTRKGKMKTLLTKLADEFGTDQAWDKKWRLIMWDIPEISNTQRNRLRALVKRVGFYQLQKSVFITPFLIPKSAVEYLKESGLMKFIRILRVDKLEDDKYLKKHFGL